MKYRSGYKYQLAENFVVQISVRPGRNISTEYIFLDYTGRMEIKKGYAWDGPSGPTFDTKSSMRGALVHDALYQLLRGRHLDISNETRWKCDDVAYRIWVSDGMWRWRAKLWLYNLKKLAGYAADPRNKKKVFEAP